MAYVRKDVRLNRRAARMRKYYLSHGIGCKTRERAIEGREAMAVQAAMRTAAEGRERQER